MITKIKLKIFIFLLGCCLFSCSQIPPTSHDTNPRLVLAELFTWARCVYCPYAAQTLDSLANEYSDSIIVIAYHRRISQDTLSPEYVENRRRFYYETGSEPVVFFDGNGPVRTENPSMNYTTYKGYIQNARNRPAPLKIILDPQVNNDSAVIKIRLIPTAIINSNNLRVLSVLVEDRVHFFLSGATESTFNNVMRAMLPDENGIPYSPQIGETARYEIKFPLRTNWILSNLRLVVFVQDFTTKEVLQSTQVRLINANNYSFTLSCISDTFRTVAPNSHVTFNFLLTNTGFQRDVYKITSQILASVLGWDVVFCVRGSCTQPGGVFYDTLNVMESDSTISITVYTNQNLGTEIVALKIQSLGDTTKQKIMRVYAQTSKNCGKQ
ncbi:MAG: Omp28-related outer membrane protein [candidate division WOR-3 bacterium]|nr:Omp28-related outer membrane protein [candidate division WOR-3 bacterium]